MSDKSKTTKPDFVDQFIEENSELMDDLAKQEEFDKFESKAIAEYDRTTNQGCYNQRIHMADWARAVGLEEGRSDDEYVDFLTSQMKSLEQIAAKRIQELEAELRDALEAKRDYAKTTAEYGRCIDIEQRKNAELEAEIRKTKRSREFISACNVRVKEAECALKNAVNRISERETELGYVQTNMQQGQDRIAELEAELGNRTYELSSANATVRELEAQLAHRHIIGKAYDITRENINRLAGELEAENESLSAQVLESAKASSSIIESYTKQVDEVRSLRAELDVMDKALLSRTEAYGNVLEENESLRAQAEELTEELHNPSYCHICGSCGEDGCCAAERCRYPDIKSEVVTECKRQTDELHVENESLRAEVEELKYQLTLPKVPQPEEIRELNKLRAQVEEFENFKRHVNKMAKAALKPQSSTEREETKRD